jgi:hypothetical protein
VEEISALKAESGCDLIALGEAGFASALIASDLVDEHQFYMNPVALRGGGDGTGERRADNLAGEQGVGAW